MADLWLPTARKVPSLKSGGTMSGRDGYAVWHTYEAPYSFTAYAGARYLNQTGNNVHFIFHPVTGELVQQLPADRSAYGLRNAAGGVETNRQGRRCIQVEVIAYARRPWTLDLTDAGRKTLAELVAFMDSHGVPRTTPAGPCPATYAESVAKGRSVAAWNGPGGHFGHSQVPENAHWDPGAIDWSEIIDAGKTPAPAPVAAAPARTSASQLAVDGAWGPATTRALQTFLRSKRCSGLDGKQLTIDGILGKNTWAAFQRWINYVHKTRWSVTGVDLRTHGTWCKAMQRLVHTTQDGSWSSADTKALQTALNKGDLR